MIEVNELIKDDEIQNIIDQHTGAPQDLKDQLMAFEKGILKDIINGNSKSTPKTAAKVAEDLRANPREMADLVKQMTESFTKMLKFPPVQEIRPKRIPPDFYRKVSQGIFYSDAQISTELTPLHFEVVDTIDAYIDVNGLDKESKCSFTLTGITREVYNIKSNSPTPEQLKTVADMLEELQHIYLLTATRDDTGAEAENRALLYLSIKYKSVYGTVVPSYEMTGYSALREYATKHGGKYPTVKSEVMQFPKGIKATTKNVLTQYMLIQAITGAKTTGCTDILYDDLYSYLNANTRKEKHDARKHLKEILDHLKTEDIGLMGYEDLDVLDQLDAPPIGITLYLK